MKLTHGLAALVLLASASVAHADISGTAAAVSDYNWRGVTQTAQGPAVQGSLDYSHSSGFYAGAWGSNVDFGDCCDESVEVDLYLGIAGGEDLIWDVGYNYYSYPGGDDLDFGEFYASLGYKWIEGKIWYANDFGNYGKSAMYYEANATYELPYNLTLAGHLGYSDGSGIEEAYGQDNYMDWSIGLTYTYSHFDFGLKWVDGSDLKTLDGTPDDVLSSESRAIFSISTAFPWTSGEE